jgi:hypothetical protein
MRYKYKKLHNYFNLVLSFSKVRVVIVWVHLVMNGVQTHNFSSDRHWLHRQYLTTIRSQPCKQTRPNCTRNYKLWNALHLWGFSFRCFHESADLRIYKSNEVYFLFIADLNIAIDCSFYILMIIFDCKFVVWRQFMSAIFQLLWMNFNSWMSIFVECPYKDIFVGY